MTTRILLINLHSARNAGDAALMLAATRQLELAFPSAHLTLLMNDPRSYVGPWRVVGSIFTWVKNSDADRRESWRWRALTGIPLLGLAVWLGRWFPQFAVWLLPRDWRELARSYAEADLVVSCPGGFLYSAGLSLALLISVLTMGLAVLAGKPLYLLPQSIGPLRRAWERRLVRWILRQARLVMVREALSLEQVHVPKAVERVLVLPDLALTFEGAPRTEAQVWLQSVGCDSSSGRPCLGLTVINWQAQNPQFRAQSAYEHALAVAVRRFISETNGTATFFPQVCGPGPEQDDRIPAHRVAHKLMDLGSQVRVITQAPEARMLKTAIGLMDIFVGTRMHSNIFAITSGVPCLAIGYQFKTLGIMRVAGLDEWVIDITQITASGLADHVLRLWQARDTIRSYLRLVLPELVEQAGKAGSYIAADFEAWRSDR